MQHHSDLERISEVVIAFTRRGALSSGSVGIAEDAAEGEVLQARQGEAEEVTAFVSALGRTNPLGTTCPIEMKKKTKL